MQRTIQNLLQQSVRRPLSLPLDCYVTCHGFSTAQAFAMSARQSWACLLAFWAILQVRLCKANAAQTSGCRRQRGLRLTHPSKPRAAGMHAWRACTSSAVISPIAPLFAGVH